MVDVWSLLEEGRVSAVETQPGIPEADWLPAHVLDNVGRVGSGCAVGNEVGW